MIVALLNTALTPQPDGAEFQKAGASYRCVQVGVRDHTVHVPGQVIPVKSKEAFLKVLADQGEAMWDAMEKNLKDAAFES